MKKYALLIGNCEYEDSTLPGLHSPVLDVEAFSRILRDPHLGEFDDVKVLPNPTEGQARRELDDFFNDKKADDLLLFYFSGHGVLNDPGLLHLAVKDTQRKRLPSTAIPAWYVTNIMDTCCSKRQILILDCCHSGAFGREIKGDIIAVTEDTFKGQGYGRVVLTSSSTMQPSHEGKVLNEQTELSIFTHYLIEGIQTGAADLDGDDWISVGEWYDYTHKRLTDLTSLQTPCKWTYNQQGELKIAKSPRTVPQLALHPELLQSLNSSFAYIRAGVVEELGKMLSTSDPGIVQAAKTALERLVNDDSKSVSARASEILQTFIEPPASSGGPTPSRIHKQPRKRERAKRYQDVQFTTKTLDTYIKYRAPSIVAPPEFLMDFQWLDQHVRQDGIDAVIDRYVPYNNHKTLHLIQQALRLSAHILRRDPEQLASQITGRLLDIPDMDCDRLLNSAVNDYKGIWLRPRFGCLDAPDGPLQLTLSGHTDSVMNAAVTKVWKRIVSASADNTLKIWDLASGKELRTLTGHTDRVKGVAVAPDGIRAVSASVDNTLIVWDVENGRELVRLRGHTNAVNGVIVTSDGKRVVSASADDTLKVWDILSGGELRTLTGHTQAVSAVAITPDGKRVVSASWDETLKVWDIDSGRELLTLNGHVSWVNAVTVTPDGKQVVSASADSTLKVWDIMSGKELRTLTGHSKPVFGIAVTPNGKRLVSVSEDMTVIVWDVASGQQLRSLKGHANFVNGVVVTPDGRKAVSASDDKTLKVWSIASGKQMLVRKGHADWVNGVAVTQDGKRAVSVAVDGTLKVWDVESGRVLLTLTGLPSAINGVAVTPDGKRVVTALGDKTLKILDVDSGRELLTLAGHSSAVTSVTVTPDGLRLVSASLDNTLKVWDTANGKVQTLIGHAHWVHHIAVTPNSKQVVSASADNTLKVWDIASGKELRTLKGHTDRVAGVAVTPDGKRVVSSSWDKTIKVWDIATGKELRTLTGHEDRVFGIAISPDGRRAVSASNDKTLRVWDLETGHELVTFIGDDEFGSVAVCADNRNIIASGAKGIVYFFELVEAR